MKIEFTKLPTTVGTIKVSLDGGQSFTEHNLADVHESGISLSDDQDYEKIRIKGPANVLKNLDVLSSINTLYESNLLPEDITGLVLKDFNGKFDKSLLQKYPNLTSVTIPNGVTTIGFGAFEYCSNLTSIDVPNSVTSIGGSAFSGCKNLTSVTIPDGVTSIGDFAFRNCSSLTNITIPNNVTSIGYSAFTLCSNLASVTIPNSVTSIYSGAFGYCSKLTSINYTGTEDQWNAISKGTDWNNLVPSDCQIVFNYVKG